MKINYAFFIILFILTYSMVQAMNIQDKKKNQESESGYIIEHDGDVAQKQPGPHSGGGETTGFAFFTKAPNMDFVFKKRILHPGSAIGYHLQKDDEIYYILSGEGELNMDGETSIVKAGTAILTRPGTHHSLHQKGDDDLIIFIVYPTH